MVVRDQRSRVAEEEVEVEIYEGTNSVKWVQDAEAKTWRTKIERRRGAGPTNRAKSL